LEPGYVNPYNGRGLVYHSLKKYDEAIRDYSKALELQPGDPLLLFNMVKCLAEQGRKFEAKQYFERGIKSFKESTELSLSINYGVSGGNLKYIRKIIEQYESFKKDI
jgi:tetratricopeptide (TPR) repeat protein